MENEIPASLLREAIAGQAKPRPVAIVGSAPSNRHWTPGNDDKQFAIPSPHVLGGMGNVYLHEWEVWAVGTVDSLERWDAFVDYHDPLTYGADLKPYLKWLSEQTKPIIVFRPHQWGKNQIIYPVERIAQKYGTYFMTSSVAWMIALAIEIGAPKIGVFGIDMADTLEYRAQRAGCKHFIELAKSKGIEVVIPPGSDLLFEPVPYPTCLEDPLTVKLMLRGKELNAYKAFHEKRIQELGAHIAAVQAEQSKHSATALKLEGGMEALALVAQNWGWMGWDPRGPSGLPHIGEIMKEPLPPQFLIELLQKAQQAQQGPPINEIRHMVMRPPQKEGEKS